MRTLKFWRVVIPQLMFGESTNENIQNGLVLENDILNYSHCLDGNTEKALIHHTHAVRSQLQKDDKGKRLTIVWMWLSMRMYQCAERFQFSSVRVPLSVKLNLAGATFTAECNEMRQSDRPARVYPLVIRQVLK